MHRAASIFERFDIEPQLHHHLGLLSLIGCDESDVDSINAAFETTEFDLTWLNQTSSAARVAIDGEDLVQALHILHDLIQERNQSFIQQ